MDKVDEPSTSSGDETGQLLEQFGRYEQLGQEVIMGKRALIELDERRQKCREALRQIRNKAGRMGEKSWLCLGNTTFIKVPTTKTTEFLEDDIKTIEETIESTRAELKKRVDEFRKLEGSKDLTELGFTLRPVV